MIARTATTQFKTIYLDWSIDPEYHMRMTIGVGEKGIIF